MNVVTIRDIETKDMKQIRDIVKDVWDFSEFMGNEKVADAAVGIYFSQFFTNSSFGKVATLNGEVVGVVFGSLNGQEPHCRMLQGNQINDIMILMRAPVKVRRDFTYYVQTINDANAELIQGKVDDYDGALDFFIVSKKAQGLKLGKQLWNHAVNYFKDHQADKIYLYTDTYCNFGFYDYNGFKRANTKDVVMEFSGGDDQVGIYLYEYSFN
jgi:ribosomal protein S18 acetylase RimI-like enzyme